MDGWTDGRTDGWTDGHSARDVGGGRATSKAGSKQARLYEPQRRYYANGSACPRLGSARSRSGARASPTLPRRLATAAVGRFVLSMPLRRRPRRSSVTRLSTRGTSRSVLHPDSAVPAASERHAGSSRAVPRHATPRHASSIPRVRFLFHSAGPHRVILLRLSLPRYFFSLPPVLATALSVLTAGCLLFSVGILVHRRRVCRRRAFLISRTPSRQFEEGLSSARARGAHTFPSGR